MEENKSVMESALEKIIREKVELKHENEMLAAQLRVKELEAEILQLRLDSSEELLSDYKAIIDSTFAMPD